MLLLFVSVSIVLSVFVNCLVVVIRVVESVSFWARQ